MFLYVITFAFPVHYLLFGYLVMWIVFKWLPFLSPLSAQSYMEDHLKNKNRLEREWEAMCGYLAEPGACNVGQDKHNTKRNRTDAVVVCE